MSNWTSVLTAGAVVIAPLSYVIKRWHTGRVERKTISKSLYIELQNALRVLDGTVKRQVMEIDVKGDKIHYTLAFIHHDMYDSLIFSGKIQLLDGATQQEIQNAFRMIKKHQEYLQYVSRLNDQSKMQNVNADKTAILYYEVIAKYELEIERVIPEIMKKLKENF